MKIIIVGGGEVGYYLAKLLEREFQDITLIDQKKEKLDLAEKNLGIATILGDATSYKVLKKAQVEKADLLISVTEIESTNITITAIAKKLGAKYTIARIENMEYLIDTETLDLRELGIDDLISPESLAAREVKYILKSPALTERFEIEKGKLVFMGLPLDNRAPVINRTVAETSYLNPNKQFMIVAINREGKTILPSGNTEFKKGDHVYFISKEEERPKVLEFAGTKTVSIKKVLVVGGSRTGKYIAHRLSKYYDIKLIEKDHDKSNDLALSLPKVQIVNGNGTEVDILKEEGIENYDALVAVTGNSETNIFSCLMAKELGVKKTIAMVENIGLFDYSQKIGVDTLVNKKLAAANFIFRNINKGSVFSHLYGINAEIMEFTVNKNSKIVGKPIKDIEFPEDAVITGVIRNNKGYITLGNFTLKIEDRVMVFTLPQSVKKVESLFK